MKIYVGNLPYECTEEDLSQLFGKYGEVVSVNLITDRESGRPKGFAFLEMAKQCDGEKAIKELNDSKLKTRDIRVSMAKPKAKNNKRFNRY